eukprot:TRINITY_DN3747_c0_g1_i4.p5 TRINITY_DN3747_c0_g1~~TRINITY_DN3747_c0_g1_i4.p5  ORF type:complete len:113 (+),score=28.96 TRINITY_DN3747_c0_g1_i4:77-415(+)
MAKGDAEAPPRKMSAYLKFNGFVRTINMITGFGLIGVGVTKFLFSSSTLFSYFNPFFFGIFGLMILSAEYPALKGIRDYFSFLNSLLGRGIFNIYLSSQCIEDFTYDDPINL